MSEEPNSGGFCYRFQGLGLGSGLGSGSGVTLAAVKGAEDLCSTRSFSPTIPVSALQRNQRDESLLLKETFLPDPLWLFSSLRPRKDRWLLHSTPPPLHLCQLTSHLTSSISCGCRLDHKPAEITHKSTTKKNKSEKKEGRVCRTQKLDPRQLKHKHTHTHTDLVQTWSPV